MHIIKCTIWWVLTAAHTTHIKLQTIPSTHTLRSKSLPDLQGLDSFCLFLNFMSMELHSRCFVPGFLCSPWVCVTVVTYVGCDFILMTFLAMLSASWPPPGVSTLVPVPAAFEERSQDSPLWLQVLNLPC